MNDLQQLEQILWQLLNGIQQVIASGEQLSDQFQGMLAETLQNIFSRIEQLRSQVTPPSHPPSVPTQVTPAPFESSNINAFNYDDKSGRLLVKFQGEYPQQNGPIYAYEGVPKQIFELFKKGAIPARTDGKNAWGQWWKGKVPSLGASMYTLIKGGAYPYQRLT